MGYPFIVKIKRACIHQKYEKEFDIFDGRLLNIKNSFEYVTSYKPSHIVQMDNIVKIYGILPVLINLKRIYDKYNYEYMPEQILKYKKQLVAIADRYKIKTDSIEFLRRTTLDSAFGKIASTKCNVQ